MDSLFFILLLIATGQGLFIGAFLTFQKPPHRVTGILLGFLFIGFSLQLFDFILVYSEFIRQYPLLAFWSLPFNLALGPLMFLYAKYYLTKGRNFNKKELIHFGPFLAHLLYLLTFYYFKPESLQQELINTLLQGLSEAPLVNWGASIFPVLLYTQLAIYIILALKRILDSQLSVQELKWLYKIWKGIIAIASFGLVQNVLFFVGINQQPITGYIAATMAVFFIYYGVIAILKKKEEALQPLRQKYHYSKLSDSDRESLADQLLEFVNKEKVFLDPELSLKKLSIEMELPERQLSEIINNQVGVNFSDFLNRHRVDEFKRRLTDPTYNHLSMLGIALGCGFKSKTTFNTAFKKMEGITPSNYKQQIEK
ncbi:MAG: helix-turn-helix domain-containing protein [Bacteroidota bacterium]